MQPVIGSVSQRISHVSQFQNRAVSQFRRLYCKGDFWFRQGRESRSVTPSQYSHLYFSIIFPYFFCIRISSVFQVDSSIMGIYVHLVSFMGSWTFRLCADPPAEAFFQDESILLKKRSHHGKDVPGSPSDM